jgi:hypothetical protein
MFMLWVVLCAGVVGDVDQQCNDYVIDGPFTVYDCGQAIAEHAVKNELAAFECRRLVRSGEDWHAAHLIAPENPKK